MRLCIGPVAATSAGAWVAWARDTLVALGDEGAPIPLPDYVLDDVDFLVDDWPGATSSGDCACYWRLNLDPDEIEYLANALYNLDLRLADGARPCVGRVQPTEARAFHLQLVQGLLFALAQEGAGRAAFVDQLRPLWAVASRFD